MLNENELYSKVKKKISELWHASSDTEHTHVIGKYYPSDAGKCIRRTFFKYKLGMNSDIKLAAKGRILMSYVVENMYLQLLEEMGYHTKVKVSKAYQGIVVSGEVDAMGQDDIIDVKTVTPTAINEIPFPADIAQINTYLWITGKKIGYLLYVKSDNPAIFKIFEIHYSSKMIETTLQRLLQLHKYLTSDVVPPKTKDTYLCKNCVFKKLCSRIG